jgi:hypothetical protein
MEMVTRQSDFSVLLVYLAAWAEDGQVIPKNVSVLSFDSSITAFSEKQSRGWCCLD